MQSIAQDKVVLESYVCSPTRHTRRFTKTKRLGMPIAY